MIKWAKLIFNHENVKPQIRGLFNQSKNFVFISKNIQTDGSEEERWDVEKKKDKEIICVLERKQLRGKAVEDIRLVKTVIETSVVCSIWISGFVLLIMTFSNIYSAHARV